MPRSWLVQDARSDVVHYRAITDTSTRLSAFSALACNTEEALALALPTLRTLFRDGQSEDSGRALGTLARRGALVAEDVPILAARLKSEDSGTRKAVINALRAMGPSAQAAAPAIAECLLHDPDGSVRATAFQALPKVAAEDTLLPTTLVQLLQDSYYQNNAWKALEDLGPRAAGAMPALIEFARGQPVQIPWLARVAAAVGPDAAGALPVLLAAYPDSRPRTRSEILAALGCIQAEPDQVVPILVENLTHADDYVRLAAVEAMRSIGRPAEDQIEKIRALQQDPAWRVRGAVMHAVVSLARESSDWEEAIARSLDDEREEVVQGALVRLKDLGVVPKAISPSLLAIVQIGPEVGRRRALEVLQRCDQLPSDAGPALLAAMSSEWVESRLTAARLIARLTPSDLKHLPAVLRRMKTDDTRLRAALAESLGWLGPAAREAIPTLEELTQDPASEVSEAARVALDRVRGK